MKLEGKISILINRDFTTIEIRDDKANITFAKLKLTPELLSAALSRQMYVDCEIDVKGLDIVGKIHQCIEYEFELPEWYDRFKHKGNSLKDYVDKLLSDGWVCDNYFGSQNSFFTKDGKNMGRAIIRRWVDA